MQLLKNPDANVVVNLIGLPLADRPPYFMGLLPRLQEMRGKTGRPHWIVVDETHHLLPAAWEPGQSTLPQQLERMVFITVHPEQIAAAALKAVSTVVAVGDEPEKTIERFCQAVTEKPPRDFSKTAFPAVEAGQVVLWPRGEGTAPIGVRVTLPVKEHHRQSANMPRGNYRPSDAFTSRDRAAN